MLMMGEKLVKLKMKRLVDYHIHESKRTELAGSSSGAGIV